MIIASDFGKLFEFNLSMFGCMSFASAAGLLVGAQVAKRTTSSDGIAVGFAVFLAIAAVAIIVNMKLGNL